MVEKNDAARRLAEAHYAVEPGIVQIFRIFTDAEDEEDSDEPIKLLEVNNDTVAAGVMPLRFGAVPALDIRFSSIIVEVTPDEFARIRARELALPDGWIIGDPLPRPIGIDAA